MSITDVLNMAVLDSRHVKMHSFTCQFINAFRSPEVPHPDFALEIVRIKCFCYIHEAHVSVIALILEKHLCMFPVL